MTQDPAQDGTSTPVTGIPIPWPPLSGPGSDREAWVTFARDVARGNEEAWEVVDEQSARIASLEAELARLRAGLAERAGTGTEGAPSEFRPAKLKPADSKSSRGRPAKHQLGGTQRRTSEDTRAAIRADLAAGLSQREAAARNGVSAMTVSRLAREP